MDFLDMQILLGRLVPTFVPGQTQETSQTTYLLIIRLAAAERDYKGKLNNIFALDIKRLPDLRKAELIINKTKQQQNKNKS